MDNAREEVKEFLNSLSRDELKELLVESGFEVEDGKGGIVFTDDLIHSKVKGIKFVETKAIDEDDVKNLYYKGYRPHYFFRVNE